MEISSIHIHEGYRKDEERSWSDQRSNFDIVFDWKELGLKNKRPVNFQFVKKRSYEK